MVCLKQATKKKVMKRLCVR